MEDDECRVDIRADSVDEAVISDIFVAGQPIGILVENAREETKALRKENDRLQDQVAELQHEVSRLTDRLEGAERAIHDEGKLGKIQLIVKAAENRRTGGQKAVLMDYKAIKQATGCSKRHAYNLIDDLPEDYEFFVDGDDLSQYGSLEIKKDAGARQLAVLCEEVPREDGEVKLFNTSDAAAGDEP